MKVADIATEFFEEWGSPTDIDVAVVASWVRRNIGQLNNGINTHFYVDATTKEILRIDPTDPANTDIIEIDTDEKDVFKAIWQVYFMDREIRKNILNYTTAPVIEVTQDGNSVRVASQTEIGRNLYTYRKAATDALKDAISAYQRAKAKPRQVVGDDTVSGCNSSGEIFRRVTSFI
jgi:hypothetical protein